MKKKNLYLITSSFPYGIGEKTFILPELSCLKEEYDITIISTASKQEYEDKENETKLDTDIKVLHIDYVGCSKWVKVSKSLQALTNLILWKEIFIIFKEREKIISRLYNAFGYFVYSSIFLEELKDKISINKDTVVYTYWYKIPTLAFARMKTKVRFKLVTRAHGHDLYNERVPCGRQPFREYMNHRLDSIFFISEKGFEYYKSNFSYDKYMPNMHICELGVNKGEKKEKVSKDFFELVSCSNVIPVKRVELIVEGLSILDDTIKVKWTHFGDGILFCEIKKLAKEKLQNKVNIRYSFKGQCENKEILNYYKRSNVDCFILTSESEGIPISIQEAMSYGIPIIATNVGGVSETFEKNGVLLNANPKPQEIAEAISFLYSLSNEEIKVMRDNSFRLWSEKFDAKKNTDKFIKILRNV